MNLFVVRLNNGASLIALDYKEMLMSPEVSTECFEFKCVSRIGTYYYTCEKSFVDDIQEVDSEEAPELLNTVYAGNKESYFLDESHSMYDMCYCIAKCKKKCARKKSSSGICTVSDFTNVCSDFESENED